jgi:hypothetical protein
MAETDERGVSTTPGGPVDASRMTPRELRGVMQWLGYEPPAQMSPADLAAAAAVAQTLPREAVAAALNPGTQVTFATPLGGLGVPGVLPVSGGQNFEAGGEVALSRVRVGPGGERTQTLEMSVELQSQIGAAYGRTDLNRLYRYADRFDVLPDGVRDRVDGWPRAAQWAVRGPNFPGSVSAEQFSGGRLSYEAVVPPELGARIAAGDLRAAPNPLDPLSMPPGASVVMRGEALEGTAFAASYRLVRGNETLTELRGQGFGVRRLEGNMVEVTTGAIAAVEREAYLGLGLGAANVGIGTERRLSDERLSVARMDLGTTEGQEAYRQFMQTGFVPDRAGPGVPQAGERRQVEAQSQTTAQANLGSFSWAATLSDWRYENTSTRWQDGSGEQRVSGHRPNGDAYEVTAQTRPDGSVDEASRSWRVALTGMHPAAASYMRTAFSGADYAADLPAGTTADMRFSDRDLMRMRDLARDELGRINPPALAHIDARRDQPFGMRTSDPGSVLHRMAAAQTPEEVFRAGFVAPVQSSGALSETLLTLSMRAHANGEDPRLPGDLTLRDRSMAPLFEHTRAAEPRTDAARTDVPPAERSVATPDTTRDTTPLSSPAAPPRASADPRQPDDPDNALYRQASGAVQRLDASLGRAPDGASESLAASLTLLARQNDMRIDHVLLSTGNGTVGQGENVIIVQGALDDPAHRAAAMPTQTAVQTPPEDTFAQLGRQRQDTPTPPVQDPRTQDPPAPHTQDTPELAVAQRR